MRVLLDPKERLEVARSKWFNDHCGMHCFQSVKCIDCGVEWICSPERDFWHCACDTTEKECRGRCDPCNSKHQLSHGHIIESLDAVQANELFPYKRVQ